MKISYIFALTAALLFTGNAMADDGATLFKDSNCTNCHKIDKKALGPALNAIAAKYDGDATAQTKLEAKVRSGGKGSFGSMKMFPTSSKVSDADIKTMVTWILTHKVKATEAK
ncbi:MAG: c-type cytochrome [Gallionellaceae bacterium]